MSQEQLFAGPPTNQCGATGLGGQVCVAAPHAVGWHTDSKGKRFQLAADFDGDTYVRATDHVRLQGLLLATYNYMADQRWHLLGDLAMAINCTPQGASARLRDLRKRKFGGFTVERRRVGTLGLYEYRLVLG